MNEPKPLVAARDHFARAERDYAHARALDEYEQALMLLEEVEELHSAFSELARRIAFTYAERLCNYVSARLNSDLLLPEPQLEHFFQLLRVMDNTNAELPSEARDLKIELAKRLIDCYLEGHTQESKQAAVEQLLHIAQG